MLYCASLFCNAYFALKTHAKYVVTETSRQPLQDRLFFCTVTQYLAFSRVYDLRMRLMACAVK